MFQIAWGLSLGRGWGWGGGGGGGAEILYNWLLTIKNQKLSSPQLVE